MLHGTRVYHARVPHNFFYCLISTLAVPQRQNFYIVLKQCFLLQIYENGGIWPFWRLELPLHCSVLVI